MAAESLTRSSAINLINGSIDSFMFSHACYCTSNMESLSEDDIELYDQMHEVISILNDDEDYRHDLETMPLEDLKEFLLMCRKMADNNNLSLKSEFPQGNFEIVEDEKKDTTIVEKSIKKLEQHGDAQIQKAVSEYRKGKRKISFDNMSQNQLGQTNQINDFYCHAISEKLIQDTPENEIRLAITLAHEFKRNAVTDTLEGETRDIVLSDTKIIESFAGTYGEEIYKKFPEYGILHYIKKIFGEEELKDFADYAFDSTGSYWKVNETCDLVDDGNSSKVFDTSGNEVYSGSTGRQGTLEAWLEIDNAFVSLMQPAGYEYDGEKWSKNPGNIDHSVIEKANNNGQLTDDQYNLIQLAAGKCSSNKEDGSEKVNLFKQFLIDYQEMNEIKTQVQIDMANRAWKWLQIQWNKLICKKSSDFSKALQENAKIKEERKWGNNEHHCDEYCEAVLKSAGKLPSDWPGTDYAVSYNDNGKNKKTFMVYYRSKLKNSPEPGWNIMLMDGHNRSGVFLAPHMVVMYLRDDGLIDFSHYTSDQVVGSRFGWTLKEMTDTGKGMHDRLGYSNFKYLPLGK